MEQRRERGRVGGGDLFIAFYTRKKIYNDFVSSSLCPRGREGERQRLTERQRNGGEGRGRECYLL